MHHQPIHPKCQPPRGFLTLFYHIFDKTRIKLKYSTHLLCTFQPDHWSFCSSGRQVVAPWLEQVGLLQSSNRCYKPTASGAADTRKKLQISRKVHSEWYNKLKAPVKFSLIQLGSSQPSPAGVHLGSEFLVVFMIYKGLEAQSQKCLLTSTKPPSLRCLDIYQLRKELYMPYCSTIGPQARQDKAANL